MLKRTITYEDFNGDKQTEDFYFNLSKSEMIELQFDSEDGSGFAETLQKVVDSKDNKKIIAEFKKLVLFAYGEKSDDGKRFVKSDEIREGFVNTAAYQELFMELATDSDKAGEFITGIMPGDMQETMRQEALKIKTAEKLSTADVATAKSTAELAAEQAPIETTEVT